MAKLSPIILSAQFINGIPANGAKLFSYAAGSSTKQTTYTGADGLTAQSNPIILDSRGETAQPVWLTEGLSYKFVFAPSTDSDPPVSPIWDVDNVTGINDASLTIDQWIVSGVTPTYVNPTTFTLPGDQTTAFEVGRRIKASVTAGTAYGTITSSVFGALTTVTSVFDSIQLDSGLSSVSYGILTNSNNSIPSIGRAPFVDSTAIIKGSVDATKLLKIEVDGLTAATTRTATMPDKDITFAGVADVTGGALLGNKIQPIDASVSGNNLTVTLNPTTLDFRNATLSDGTVTTITLAAAISLTVPSGATLGGIATQLQRYALIAMNNAGTIELAIHNMGGGLNLDETDLISTTILNTSSDSNLVAYSTTARSNLAYRVVGFVDITCASAGVWASSPSKKQGYGGQAIAANSSIGYGQIYQPVTRTPGTPYYNTTGKPIYGTINIANVSNTNATITLVINGGAAITILSCGGGASGQVGGNANYLIPVASSYQFAHTNVSTSSYVELR